MLGHQVGALTPFVGEKISLEVDLRSRQKRERTAHLFIDRKQSPLFFYELPQSIKIGIYFVQPASVEFESLDELCESSAMPMKGEFGYVFDGEKDEGRVLDESLEKLTSPKVRRIEGEETTLEW